MQTALDMAKTVLGYTEGKDRAALIDYMKTGGVNIDPATRAWCAAFINASLNKAGYSGTGSDLARSFMEWGNAVEPGNIQPGDIGVYPRGSDPMYGHAGIVESYDPKTGMVKMISGNTGSEGSVAQASYNAKDALGFRRAAQQLAAAGYTPEQIKAAFLSSIASTESPGYDVMYGGGKFTDFSRHPNQAIPIESGPNKGKTSSAAGRYQFIAPTWEEQAKLSGVTDFSAASQDKVAWDYADRLYKAKTGGSLLEALQSQDPGRMNAAAQILSGAWTSLPGGIEQAKGYGTKTFADVFGGYLGEAGTAAPAAPDAPASPYVLPKPEKKDGALAKMAEAAMSGLQGGPAANWQQPQTPPQVGAARIDQPAVASIDPQGAEFQRQKLAQILAKLNAGSLVG